MLQLATHPPVGWVSHAAVVKHGKVTAPTTRGQVSIVNGPTHSMHAHSAVQPVVDSTAQTVEHRSEVFL